MKKLRTYSVLVLVVLFCGAVKAEIHHFAGGSIGVGEWSLLPMQEGEVLIYPSTDNLDAPTTVAPMSYKPSIGGAGTLTFQYEFQYKPHAYSPVTLLVDAGIGAKAGWTSFLKGRGRDLTDVLRNCEDFEPLDPSLLPPGTPEPTNLFSYYYELKNRQDNYLNVGLQVPLMVGLQYRHFYGLVGAKFNFNLFNRVHTMGDLSTYGIFNDYIHSKAVPEDYQWRNINGYQFFDNMPKDTTFAPTSPNTWSIDATIELGYRLGDVSSETGFDIPKRKIEYRIAAFADFGVTNWRKNANNNQLLLNRPEAYDVTAENYTTDGSNRSMVGNVQPNDIMAVDKDAMTGASLFGTMMVRNLFVGVKFTILFELPKPGECVICRDSYLPTDKSGFSGRGVKYEEE